MKICFFRPEWQKIYHLLTCRNVCKALCYLNDNIYTRSVTTLYRQIFRWELSVLLLFLVYFYLIGKSHFILFLLVDKQKRCYRRIFNSNSRYLKKNCQNWMLFISRVLSTKYTHKNFSSEYLILSSVLRSWFHFKHLCQTGWCIISTL